MPMTEFTVNRDFVCRADGTLCAKDCRQLINTLCTFHHVGLSCAQDDSGHGWRDVRCSACLAAEAGGLSVSPELRCSLGMRQVAKPATPERPTWHEFRRSLICWVVARGQESEYMMGEFQRACEKTGSPLPWREGEPAPEVTEPDPNTPTREEFEGALDEWPDCDHSAKGTADRIRNACSYLSIPPPWREEEPASPDPLEGLDVLQIIAYMGGQGIAYVEYGPTLASIRAAAREALAKREKEAAGGT